MYDLIIIGAGPAGITASVYAARKMMSSLVITRDIGGQAAWSGDIENYTGYQFITGPDLVNKFEEHMRNYNITVKENEPVVDINKNGGIIKEIILAINHSVEGDATSLYISAMAKDLGYDMKLSRLAKGLPTGSDIRYADEITLGPAIVERKEI